MRQVFLTGVAAVAFLAASGAAWCQDKIEAPPEVKVDIEQALAIVQKQKEIKGAKQVIVSKLDLQEDKDKKRWLWVVELYAKFGSGWSPGTIKVNAQSGEASDVSIAKTIVDPPEIKIDLAKAIDLVKTGYKGEDKLFIHKVELVDPPYFDSQDKQIHYWTWNIGVFTFHASHWGDCSMMIDAKTGAVYYKTNHL